MNKDFLSARIEFTKNLIIKYEEALLALQNPSIAEYMIDTGQSKQKVVRADIKNMQSVLDGLYNQCSMLENRLNGGSSIIVRPSW